MRYLLVTHAPFASGTSPATLRSGDMWLADLTTQVRALRDVGFDVTVATPLDQAREFRVTGSFNTVEFSPADLGFTYVPLPRYLSAGQYFLNRRALNRQLRAALADADVMQCDYGGYPMPMGVAATRVAARCKPGLRKIWIFDGADPFPRLELEAQNTRNPLKRWIKRRRITRLDGFCQDVIANFDLVFAHNAAVVQRYAELWDDKPREHGPARCHRFDRSFVSDDLLLTDAELAEKQRHLKQPGTLKLVVAGRQIAIKGTDQLIRAVAKCRRLNADVTLDIFGEGADLETFRTLAADLKMSQHIHFRGTVPYGKPLFDEWDHAHALVITNLTAEISRNVLLGAARGLLLISYANPGTDAMLSEHDAALLVRRGDEDELAAAILHAHRSRARAAELIANGVILARSRTLTATHRERAKLAAQLFDPPHDHAPSHTHRQCYAKVA